MINKKSFIGCTIVLILSNLLMITVVNHGEETMSNIFLIVLTVIFLPSFLWAIDHKQLSLIRLESSLFIFLTALSVMRLLNRIDSLPVIVNGLTNFLVIAVGTVLLVVSIIRIRKK